jgi:RNA polymerase sigma-70 factor (ECF subfamily)
VLARAAPSPVVALNRAVALGMVRGPAAALAVIEPLAAEALSAYAPAHAAMAEMLARLGRKKDAAEACRRARALTFQEPEQRHLQERINALLG